ncbi:unnamed protein product, partial [marine sediment metagenome]
MFDGGGSVTSSQFTIYLDGGSVSTGTHDTGSKSAPLTGLDGTRIGHHQAGWIAYFNGIMDEVRISSVKREAEWIKASYETQRDHLLDWGSEEEEEADTVAPEAIDDLEAATGTNEGEVDLTWTAPGDDGNTGTADSYDIRYSDAEINEGNWGSATPVTPAPPAPSIATTEESMTVTGLTWGNTYWFAIKTSDEVPNESAISNSDSAGAQSETPPTVSVYLPDDNATDVELNATLKLTFDEDMAKGTGNIKIYNSGGLFQEIAVTEVTIAGAEVTIPHNDFAYETGYYVTMASGVLEDLAANDYAGILNETTWNF